MYIRLFLQLLRPKVAVMLLLFVCLGMASSGGNIVVSWQFLLLILTLALWYVNATAINDIADRDIDMINLKGAAGRPLVRKTASLNQVKVLFVVSGCLALLTSFAINTQYGYVIGVGLLLNSLYSLPPVRLSYRGIVAPLLLPIGYVVIPFIGGWAIAGGELWWSLLAGCYVGFVGRIILKDFRDIKGDTAYGKRTFVVRHGKQATCIASVCFWLAGNLLLGLALKDWVWLVIQPLFVLIVACIWQLSHARTFHDEQVLIGLSARLANGVLITLLAYLLSREQLVALCIVVAMFASAHIAATRNIQAVKIGYKG